MMKNKILSRSVLFCLGLLCAAALIVLFAPRNKQPLTILFTHDLHSNLEEYAMLSGGDKIIITGGYARLSGAIETERHGKENSVLLLDAGDFSMGTLLHTIRAQYSAELVTMGMMGYDATTLGNHDFDFGPDPLAQALISAKSKDSGRLAAIVSANTYLDPQIPQLESLRKAFKEYPVLPYKIFRRSGMKIGVFGLMGKDAASVVPQAKPVVFEDYIKAAHKTVDALRNKERADMVVCLSHCGTWPNKSISEDEILAGAVPQIDVIISGHTHTVLDRYMRVGDTYIISCGAYGQYLGRLELIRGHKKRFKALDYRLIPITGELSKDPVLCNQITAYAKEAQRSYLDLFHYRYAQPLAHSAFSLERPDWDKGERANCITSGLGDLVSDAFIYAVKKSEGEDYREISLVIEPFGQIRVALAQGTLTVNDVFRALSLGMGLDGKEGYALVTFWLSGKEIESLLEIETTLAPLKEDTRLQISGMRFFFDPKAAPFTRVRNIQVEAVDGSFVPLEEDKLYRVCSNWNMLLMGEYLKAASAGRIKVVPKNKTGEVITDISTTRVFINKDNPEELKEWLALAMYLQSMPDLDGDGLPDIEERYRLPRQQIIAGVE